MAQWLVACAAHPVAAPKTKESHARVLSTRTVRTEVEGPSVKTIGQRLGPNTPELLSDLEATVIGVQRVKNTSYLRVRNSSPGPWLELGAILAHAECSPRQVCQVAEAVHTAQPMPASPKKASGAGNLRAAGASQRDMSRTQESELLIRLGDSAAAEGLQAVTLQSYRAHRGGLQRRILIHGMDTAPKDGGLQAAFALSWAEFVGQFADDEPLAAFVAARMSRSVAGGKLAKDIVRGRSHTRSDLADLMEFYTGRSEVRRTLQTDRGLGIAAQAQPNTIAIASIQGVEHEERDYRKLLSADTGARTFVPHPLAAAVPSDALVLEFASIRDLVTLPQRIQQRLGQILGAIELRPGDDKLLERYREQLLLEQTFLAEKLGHLAIGAAVLVIGDPYLREGSDLSLVLQVRERQLLETALAGFVVAARHAHPELESKQILLVDTPVAVHQTPDGQLRRFQAWVDSELLLSNSRQAMMKLLELRRDKSRSLAQSADYQWARSIAPYATEAEQAHLFFGDAFVEKITGPRSKILESRRMRALAELRAVEYAAHLFGWMQGNPPKSLSELLASGWLTKSDLVHFDGSPITFDPARGAYSRFGSSQLLLPIADLEITQVSKAEADAYAQFRSTYERGLRGALDPTTLRFFRTAGDDQWRTELHILPLTPTGEIGSTFREIVRSVGRGAVEAGKNPEGLRVALGISRESPLRDLATGAIHGMLSERELTLGFLGDWVEVGLADDPWLWNFAVAEHVVPELDAANEERSEFGLEHNLQRLPVWAALQVKSPLLLTAALAAVRSQSLERLGEWIKWHDDAKYRGQTVTRVEVRLNGEATAPLSIHFALANDVLLVSINRQLLERRIDEVLAGLRPKEANAKSGSSQLVLSFEGGSTHYLTDILAAVIDSAGMDAHRRACVGLALLAAGYGEQAANGVERSSLGLRVLGYVPESPAGPGLSIKNGQCEHPIYGTLFEPHLPDGRDATSPLHAAARNLASLRFGLSVVPHVGEQEFIGRAEVGWK